MAGTLNTSKFLAFQSLFKERCMVLLIEAYHISIKNQIIKSDFDENDISAILHFYICKNKNRIKWEIFTNTENFIFDDSKPFVKGFAAKQSRIDLKFGNFWSGNEFEYFVEAKNLRANDSTLKRRYITTGINNFLTGGKYGRCDGLLVGYILEGDTNTCIKGINVLLQKDTREKEQIEQIEQIEKKVLSQKIYISMHPSRELLHLFFDY